MGLRGKDDLAGRESELEVVASLVRALDDGSAAMLVVEGEGGIGKSRVVLALVEEALAMGAVVFRGEGHPFERAHPFGVVVEALGLRSRSSDRRRAAIAGLLAEGAQPAEAGTVAPDVRYRVVEQILDLLEAECSEHPTVLVLEDIHWADDSTLLAIRSLVRGLVGVPLLVVVSLRPSPRSSDVDQLLGDLLDTGGVRLRLEPLTADAVHVLASAQLGAPPGPMLAALLAKAGGNPLLVVETLRSLSEDGALRSLAACIDVENVDLPESLRELVIRRLHYLPDATRDLLRITSVIGDNAAIREIALVAGRPLNSLASELLEAFQARLLDERGDHVTFRHQLVHDAVYQEIPAPVRRALHRNVATALVTDGADSLRVADHLALGAERGDMEAVGWLRRAAREAFAGSPGVTVELLQRAEALLPGGHPDADVVSAELVEALLRAGKVADAAARAEVVLGRRHRPDVDVPLRLSLISALSLQNRAQELIESAATFLAEVPDLPLSGRALVLAQESLGRTFSGDVVGAEAAARVAVDAAISAGDVAMHVWGLATLSVAVKWQGRYQEATDICRLAVGLAADPAVPGARLRHPRFFLGMVLCDTDLFDEARRVLADALDEYEEFGSVWLLSDTLLMSAIASFLIGRWDEAEQGFDAGAQVAQEQGVKLCVMWARALQAVIGVARDDLPSAEATLAPLRAQLTAANPGFGFELVVYAESLLAETKDQAADAFELLHRCWELNDQRQNRYYDRWLAPPLVRLALTLSRHDVAAQVTAVMVASAAAAPEVPSVVGAAERCRGMVAGDPDVMLEAVRLARESRRVLDLAGACEDAAAVLAAAGRAADATELLAEALDCYEGVAASAWVRRVTAELRRLGVHRGTKGPRRRPAGGWAGLTESERAVSELVAAGLTNRDVARRLHISPHTVNTHLRHVFDKLSVSSRAALATVVARSTDSP